MECRAGGSQARAFLLVPALYLSSAKPAFGLLCFILITLYGAFLLPVIGLGGQLALPMQQSSVSIFSYRLRGQGRMPTVSHFHPSDILQSVLFQGGVMLLFLVMDYLGVPACSRAPSRPSSLAIGNDHTGR